MKIKVKTKRTHISRNLLGEAVTEYSESRICLSSWFGLKRRYVRVSNSALALELKRVFITLTRYKSLATTMNKKCAEKIAEDMRQNPSKYVISYLC